MTPVTQMEQISSLTGTCKRKDFFFFAAKGRSCNVWGPGDGPLEMYFEKTRTRRRKREKDSERYSPESGHIRKRYGDWREYLVVR